MFRLASAVFATTLSCAVLAAETQSTAREPAPVVALNTHGAAAMQPKSLDDYAGVYATANGALFVVSCAGDSLAIELPESMSLPIRTVGGPSFVLDGAVLRIAFETDADGAIRMVVSQASGEPVVATRVPLPRGIVTIQDI